jgi:arginine exporter protein ArgO
MRAFAEGVVAGLGIAIPVGAIAVLIIDLAMRRGFARAVPAALGTATADLAYAAVAAVAGIAVAAALEPHQRRIELMSAAVLAAIVVYRMVRLARTREDAPAGPTEGAPPAVETAPTDGAPAKATAAGPTGDGPSATYAGFLALTLVNPLTVTYFAALILGLGNDTLGSGADKALFVIGAFIASAAWQLLLAGFGALLHHRLSERALLVTALLGNLLIAALAIRLALGA